VTIDRETANQGAALIATAITELAEDLHAQASAAQRSDPGDIARRATTVASTSADVLALAGALAVLARAAAT